jgi:ElaA protein
MIQWQWSRFEDLTTPELYDIIQCREAVFVVEQDCAYQDVDGLDQSAWHLIAWELDDQGQRKVSGYLRLLDPGCKYSESSIGRLLTTSQARGTGLGKALVEKGLSQIEIVYGASPCRISAQTYLLDFYSAFGFQVVTEPYDEDGIPHVEMLRS